jgi:hypothetical protein
MNAPRPKVAKEITRPASVEIQQSELNNPELFPLLLTPLEFHLSSLW